MWRCLRQTRPAAGRGPAVVVSDPRKWLDEHTAELLSRPGARLWGYAGSDDEIRRMMGFFEGNAVSNRRSLQRVVQVGEETITLTAEPA